MAPYGGTATSDQIDTLLNFLDEHRDLARGRLRTVHGKVQAKRLWHDLCKALNSMGGCTKTVQQWQKVWFDRKHLAKKAAVESRKLAAMTGGEAPELSHWERKVLTIIGEGFRAGSAVTETNENTSSSSSDESYPQPQKRARNIRIKVEEDAETSQATRRQPPRSQATLASRSSSQSASPRRLRSAADARSRLYQYVDGRTERDTVRNIELAGIRTALEELVELGREYLEILRQNKASST